VTASRLRSTAGLLVLIAAPTVALAQRALHWESVAVTAHLDATGQLRVDETQTMVFTGDWNGGERKFNVRRGQFSFKGISRYRDGRFVPMAADARLDGVDEYWLNGTILRWRSRRSSDRPFSGTPLRYEMRYALSSILLKQDDHFLLDHDFAFADRNGAIQRFVLQLSLDPVWRPLSELQGTYKAGPLAPGRSFVLRLPLAYTGSDLPASMVQPRAAIPSTPPAVPQPPPPRREVAIAAAVLFGVCGLMIAWFFVREERYGRFARVDADGVDEAWLRDHILKHPAEVVGAAWDGLIGKAEVVALIARMVGEGKLESEIGQEADSSSMTLRLEVDRRTLERQERTLVDALFFDGRTETSTQAVKAHYENTGFDPAAAIRGELEQAVEALFPDERPPRSFKAVTVLLFLGAAGLFAVGWFVEGSRFMVVASAVVMLIVACVGWIAGTVFRANIHWGRKAAMACLAPALVIALGTTGFLWMSAGSSTAADLPPIHALAVVTLAIGFIVTAVNSLKSRQRRGAIALRKTLAAGRSYFEAAFDGAPPERRKQWYPWVLAFGLDRQAPEWSTPRPGRDDRDESIPATGSHESSHSGSPASESWTGFGGGRSGGAGASASWAVAAGGMAAGVRAASAESSSGSDSSSSSDSGSSSSDSSSGGGGGGGW
jgi:uncharacterized membrane protein YgcG